MFALVTLGFSGTSVVSAQVSILGNLYQEAKIVPQTFIPSSDGTAIAVTEQGPKDGRTILFVHGFAHSGDVFYNQFSSPALLPFHIVTMDLRGHGFSDKPNNPAAYSDHGLFADDINAVIQGLHLNKPVLAGWSFGGIPVFDYLQKYGDSNLSGVELIDSIACPNTACSSFILNSISSTKAFADLASQDAPTNFLGAQEYITTESVGAANKEQTLILRTIITETPQFVLSGLLQIPGLTYAQTMASLTVPVLIQYGSNDPIIDLNTIPVIQGLIKTQTTKVYSGAAHIPFILNAEQFNTDLAHWLTFTVR